MLNYLWDTLKDLCMAFSKAGFLIRQYEYESKSPTDFMQRSNSIEFLLVVYVVYGKVYL
jgi:hypothetical protein